ncbi:hypothetical protein HUB97_15440 [Halorubraceae archaeon YAN]|nr:hypothetical protein [Halorubraceae archaeon YAN]
MKDPIQPSLDFELRPALEGSIALLIVGVPLFLYTADWITILFAAAMAGAIVGLRTDRYAQTAINGLVGSMIGFLFFIPVIIGRQLYLFQFVQMDGSDSILYASVFASSEIIALAPATAILAFTAAAIVDFLRFK